MQRTLLIMALLAAAGTAVAQTSSAPASGGATTPGTSQTPSTYGADTANANGQPTGRAAIAQKRIEADGYKNVQGLALGEDGLWHGRAMRGNNEVQVTVDKQGNVSQQ
jgi:hypothetical protein